MGADALQAFPQLLGLPADLWVVLFLFFLAVVVIAVRRGVSNPVAGGTPKRVMWLGRNYSAKRFPARDDLKGIFIDVLSANSKKQIETLKKSAVPVKVLEIEGAKAYVLEQPKELKKLTAKIEEELAKQDLKEKKREDLEKKLADLKSFPVTDEDADIVYFDVETSRTGRTTEYLTVEGTGRTIDYVKQASEAKQEEKGSTAVIHEETSAVKTFLKLWAQAAAGGWQALILPMAAGGGLGMSALFLVLIISGHLR